MAIEVSKWNTRILQYRKNYIMCQMLHESLDFRYSQPHLIRTWLIGSSGSDQDFTPDNHCYDRQVASLSVITMAYQVRNLDHFPELLVNQVPIKWG